jgi:predicted phosphoadenosine phosphosulfate sulfurtransferase
VDISFFLTECVERENVAKVCVFFLVVYDTKFSLIIQYISSMLILTPKKINFFLLSFSAIIIIIIDTLVVVDCMWRGRKIGWRACRGGWTDEKSFYV